MAERPSLQSVLTESLRGYCQGHILNPRQWQVCHHILACRTEALGEMRLRCNQCGEEQRFYHACRDRHCPRCQRQASQRWCERQRGHTLEVGYYHVVFTLPEAANPWAEIHPEVIYDQLLKSAWATLSTFAADPKRLNGQLGATLVLHTWGQTLTRHLHVHALVPGGALSEQGTWKAARGNYLFPVRALSRYFRGHFVARLRERYEGGEFSRLTGEGELKRGLDALMRTDWVVYTKRCLQHTEAVIDYLGRYSHRIALSDNRLLDYRHGKVQLRYRDYRDDARQKILHLSGEELIRRFLLHVLPKGFMRIRHCGFLANRCRRAKLVQIRRAIGQAEQAVHDDEPSEQQTALDRYRCPRCGLGRLILVAFVAVPTSPPPPQPPPRRVMLMH